MDSHTPLPPLSPAEVDPGDAMRLFAAVIWNAFQDAFERPDISILNTDRHCDPTIIRQEARRWLTSDLEPWRSSRIEVCDYAGVSESIVRDAAKRRLALARADDAEREAEAHAKAKARLDEMLARLLDRADHIHPGRLDQYLNRLAEREAETV